MKHVTALFLGGPVDGRRMAVAGNPPQRYVLVEVPPAVPIISGSASGDVRDFSDFKCRQVRYVRHEMIGEGSHWLYAVEEIKDPLLHLIVNYKGKK